MEKITWYSLSPWVEQTCHDATAEPYALYFKSLPLPFCRGTRVTVRREPRERKRPGVFRAVPRAVSTAVGC